MSKSPSGGIAIGQAGSKARYENSKIVCPLCYRKFKLPTDQVKSNGMAQCDCCEEGCSVTFLRVPQN
jgi:hypothetical protein